VGESLVIEVRPHVMRDGNDVRSEILEMAIERRRLFEELEFDHVTVMAVVVVVVVVVVVCFVHCYLSSSSVRVCFLFRFVVFAFVVSASSSSSLLLFYFFVAFLPVWSMGRECICT
jgi:hypothetical protein